jgi:hypothetical protein
MTDETKAVLRLIAQVFPGVSWWDATRNVWRVVKVVPSLALVFCWLAWPCHAWAAERPGKWRILQLPTPNRLVVYCQPDDGLFLVFNRYPIETVEWIRHEGEEFRCFEGEVWKRRMLVE